MDDLINKTSRDKLEYDKAVLLRHTIKLGPNGGVTVQELKAKPGTQITSLSSQYAYWYAVASRDRPIVRV